MQILRGRRSAVYHLAVSPDSRFVAAGGLTELHVWDLHDPDAKPTRHAEFSRTLQFVSDGRLLSDSDAGWRLHDPVGGRTVRWERTANLVHDTFASPCGSYVVGCEAPNGLCCWRLQEDGLGLHRELVWSLPETSSSGPPLFTPDSQSFAFFDWTWRRDRQPWSVHRTADGKPVAQLEGQGNGYSWRQFTPDGSKFLSGVQSRVYEWDARAGGAARLAVRHPTGRHFRSAAIHPGGATLAATTNDTHLSLYHLASGGVLRTFDWRIGRLNQVAFTPDGTRCVVAGSSGKVLLFDVE